MEEVLKSARERFVGNLDETEIKFHGIDLLVHHTEYGMSAAYVGDGWDDWDMLKLFNESDKASLWEIVRKENGYDLSPADRAYRG
jgi:hypothetical protein